MKVFFPFTLVLSGPTGMFVANGGETHDLPDDFALSLIESGKAEAVDVMQALVDSIAAPALGDDGEPLNPPDGDIAADIANPAVIKAPSKGKRGKIAATPLDAPVA
jgi:hypothetical protein